MSVKSFEPLFSSDWNELVQKLPKSLDFGSHRAPEYLFLITAAIFFFLALYISCGVLLNIIFMAVRDLPTPNFTHPKRVDYLTRVVAIIHAILVTVTGFYGTFYYCDDSTKSVFTDPQCITQPKVFHALSAIFTIGYLSFDFLATLMFNHQNNALTYQTYAHHIAGIVGFYIALVLRPNTSGMLVVAVANQFTEISTPFMNMRQLLFTHKMNESKVATVNALLFASTFLFGRLIFQICLAYTCFPWLYNEMITSVHTNYTFMEQFGFYFCCAAQTLGLLLNIHWMSLVTKGLIRMFSKSKKSGGNTPTGDDKKGKRE